MGLDISTELIVGVPLLQIGKIEERSRQVPTTNKLGKPTGRSSLLKEEYFIDSSDFNCLIGSNEESISDGTYSSFEYNYQNLLNERKEDPEESDWIHSSDFQGHPDLVVIGLSIKGEKGREMGRYESFLCVNQEKIDEAIPLVKVYLNSEFGYHDEVYVISFPIYSY